MYACTQPPSLLPHAVSDAPRTFRTFVTGPSNALAYNAALTVARAPGSMYNPLFILGARGMGKTHLLEAIAAYLARRLDGAEPIVITGAAFAQDFSSALRRGALFTFRRRYRRAGALLLDDIAGVAGHAAAAEEAAQTLAALRAQGRQIVFADARRPSEMRGLPGRLAQQVATSLIATLAAPDEATRLAILHGQAARAGLLPPDLTDPCDATAAALTVLAHRLRGSVRDLDVALARLREEVAAGGGPPSVALAQQVAGEVNRAARQPCGHTQVEGLLHAVCDYYGIPRRVLLSESRAMPVAQARQVAMYLLREDGGLTAMQVGQELARDHSTVLHGHARIADALKGGDHIMSTVLDSIRARALETPHDMNA